MLPSVVWRACSAEALEQSFSRKSRLRPRTRINLVVIYIIVRNILARTGGCNKAAARQTDATSQVSKLLSIIYIYMKLLKKKKDNYHNKDEEEHE